MTLGPIVDGLRVIRTGLAANDRVIIEGQQRVRPGMKVSPKPGRIVATAPTAPRPRVVTQPAAQATNVDGVE